MIRGQLSCLILDKSGRKELINRSFFCPTSGRCYIHDTRTIMIIINRQPAIDCLNSHIHSRISPTSGRESLIIHNIFQIVNILVTILLLIPDN